MVFVGDNRFIYPNVVPLYRNIDDVDKTMDEINEQTENMKQIQEALSTPIGTAADIDEVNLDLWDFFIFLFFVDISERDAHHYQMRSELS